MVHDISLFCFLQSLSFAASRGHGRVVRTLLDHGADPKIYSSDGQTASDIAYSSDYPRVCIYMYVLIRPFKSISLISIVFFSDFKMKLDFRHHIIGRKWKTVSEYRSGFGSRKTNQVRSFLFTCILQA